MAQLACRLTFGWFGGGWSACRGQDSGLHIFCYIQWCLRICESRDSNVDESPNSPSFFYLGIPSMSNSTYHSKILRLGTVKKLKQHHSSDGLCTWGDGLFSPGGGKFWSKAPPSLVFRAFRFFFFADDRQLQRRGNTFPWGCMRRETSPYRTTRFHNHTTC